MTRTRRLSLVRGDTLRESFELPELPDGVSYNAFAFTVRTSRTPTTLVDGVDYDVGALFSGTLSGGALTVEDPRVAVRIPSSVTATWPAVAVYWDLKARTTAGDVMTLWRGIIVVLPNVTISFDEDGVATLPDGTDYGQIYFWGTSDTALTDAPPTGEYRALVWDGSALAWAPTLPASATDGDVLVYGASGWAATAPSWASAAEVSTLSGTVASLSTTVGQLVAATQVTSGAWDGSAITVGPGTRHLYYSGAGTVTVTVTGTHTPGGDAVLHFAAGDLSSLAFDSSVNAVAGAPAELVAESAYKVYVHAVSATSLVAHVVEYPSATTPVTDTTPPTITAAAVLASDTDAVVVTASETLGGATHTLFTIDGYTITGATVDGSTCTIQLSTAVPDGASLTLVWSEGAVTDTAGNPIAAGSQSITPPSSTAGMPGTTTQLFEDPFDTLSTDLRNSRSGQPLSVDGNGSLLIDPEATIGGYRVNYHLAGGTLPADLCVVAELAQEQVNTTFWGIAALFNGATGVGLRLFSAGGGSGALTLGNASSSSEGDVAINTTGGGFPTGWGDPGQHALAFRRIGNAVTIYCRAPGGSWTVYGTADISTITLDGGTSLAFCGTSPQVWATLRAEAAS